MFPDLLVAMPNQAPVLLYSEIRVRDLSRAVRFYRAFGLLPVHEGKLTDGTALVWLRDRRSNHLLQLFYLPPKSRLYKPFRRRDGLDFQLMFTVSNAERLLRRLRKLGGKVVGGFEAGGVRLATVRDPDGTWLELLSWADSGRRNPPAPPQIGLLASPSQRSRR